MLGFGFGASVRGWAKNSRGTAGTARGGPGGPRVAAGPPAQPALNGTGTPTLSRVAGQPRPS